MSSRTPSQNGAKLKPDTASGSSISRSNSSVSLDASMEFSSPSRPLSRSSSTLNVTLDLEPQQIVYPHTLSSVMNDPKARLASFSVPNINPSPILLDAPLSSYKPYLQRTHEIYSILQSQRKSNRDAARENDENSEISLQSGQSESNSTSIKSNGDSSILEVNLKSPRAREVIDSRKEVPSHFFDEHFDLAIPQTFYRTMYDGTPHNILSERIDQYLELVERDLTDKLNRRSEAFFRALRDLQSLHLTVAGAFRTVEDIRDRLKIADEELVVKSLEIVGKKTKKQNFGKIQKKLVLIQALKRSIPTIENMITEESYFDAIETIRTAETILKNELSGAICVGAFKSKLEQFSKRVKGHLSALFVEYACGKAGSSGIILQEEIDKLKPLLVEMQNIGQLISSLETYSEIQQENIKRMVQECFEEQNDFVGENNLKSSQNNINPPLNQSNHSLNINSSFFKDSEEQSMSIYEKQAEQLSMEDFQSKLTSLLDDLLSTVTRIKSVYHLMDEVFKEMEEQEKNQINFVKQEIEEYEKSLEKLVENQSSSSLSSSLLSEPSYTRSDIVKQEEENQLQKRLRTQILIDSADIIFTAAELSNTLIARIIKTREEQHVRLPVSDFAHFYNLVSSFVRSIDKQVGRPCPTLRATINQQAKSMFEDWHRRMCKKLSHTLNAENWARAEIAAEFTAIIHCLFNPKQEIHSIDATKETDNAKSLTLGTERYVFVNSELIFVKLIYDYLVFLDTLPSMYTDVITQLAETINLWSKITYQLVLKQGAVENQVVQGNINVGHLSLAANCLGVQIALIPKIKERVLIYIHDPNDIAILSALDKSIEECTNHQQEIYHKMITTMKNRVDACFKIYKVDEQTDKVNAAITKLMEATKKMHKILKTYLSPTPFKSIFKQIVIIYNSQIKTHLNTLVIKTPKEKSKLLVDVHHIITELRGLEGVEDPTDELAEYVHERFKQ